MNDRSAADVVAIILAAGLVSALLVMTAAAMYGAVMVPERGLGENATQVLTGICGGITGVLGAYVGYRFGVKKRGTDDDAAG